MSSGHRVRRRQERRRAGRFRLTAAVFGLALVGGVVGVWQFGGDDADPGLGTSKVRADGGLPRLVRPETGRPTTVTTPEGFAYTLEGVRRGISAEFAAAGSSPGAPYAYAEYVLTNSGKQEALLDYPPELFMRVSAVPEAVKGSCGHRTGTKPEMCEVPSRRQIVGMYGGSAAPVKDDAGATHIPVGASYLVREVTEFPVPAEMSDEALGLYVLNVRFTGDRVPRPLFFPG